MWQKNLVLQGFFAFEKTKKIFCSLEISYKKKGGVKMKQVFGDELKKIQLEILDSVARFCEENHISYWIDSGTLLGAIRHKGYIPWDDDIDIGMLRKDYDRFAAIFNSKQTRYQFLCIENTPNFYLPYGKVCDPNTLLYEPDEDGYKLAINIDIFVYDNAPDDDSIVTKMYDIRDALRKKHDVKTQGKIKDRNLIKKTIKIFRRFCYRLLYPKNQIIKMVENSKKYADEPTTRVGNFTAYTRMVCNKNVFDEFIEVEFEKKRYKAPIGYDEWLKSFYGDYMKLPPEEKRISHHKFVAYANIDE